MVASYLIGLAHSACVRTVTALAVLSILFPVGLVSAAGGQWTTTAAASQAPLRSLPVATSPGGKTTSVRLFFVALGDNGKLGKKIGCGDSLVEIRRSIAPTAAPLSAAYRLLLHDHRQHLGRSGFYNPLYQARLTLKRATIAKGRATIYLAGTLNLRGECDDPRVGAQLRQTALQFPVVHAVSVYINNVPLWKRLGGKG